MIPDKELIAMCDCPEIQDKWETKEHDVYKIKGVKGTFHAIHPLDNIKDTTTIFIPRIEDVLVWETAGGLRTTTRVMQDIIRYIEQYNYWDLPLLKVCLAYHMERTYKKDWNGKAWV